MGCAVAAVEIAAAKIAVRKSVCVLFMAVS